MGGLAFTASKRIPPLLDGMARLVDLRVAEPYRHLKTGAKADIFALQNDWEMVVNDWKMVCQDAVVAHDKLVESMESVTASKLGQDE